MANLVIAVGMEYSVGVRWCSVCTLVSMVPLGPPDICTSKRAVLQLLSSSFVSFISRNTWLMYKKKVFTSIRFKIAIVSFT